MNRRVVLTSVVAAGLVVLPVTAAPAASTLPAVPASTTRVSIATQGTQADNSSIESAISANGRYVAFTSFATNLVPGDTNSAADVFVRDRVTGTTSRVSVNSRGRQADAGSAGGVLSSDGRYVAYYSFATNLVPGDTNNAADVFVHDRSTGATTRVSLATGGGQANGGSFQPAISGDGRYVAFDSVADNLVTGDRNGVSDVFVSDRRTGATNRVSRSTSGTQANDSSFQPELSADGRVVAYYSFATNLVARDTNGKPDVFVRNRMAATTTRVSVASDGTQGDDASNEPAVSADGRYVAYSSYARNLVPNDTNRSSDIFVRDRVLGTTTRISDARNTVGIQNSNQPVFSANGRYLAYSSYADDLVPGDTNGRVDVFVRDLATGATTRVSVASDGTQADSDSYQPALSADGRFVAFYSFADNLVAGDTTGTTRSDVFVRDRGRAAG